MKLYVWEGCFTDCTDGLAVVLAKDVKEARKVLREKIGNDDPDIGLRPQIYPLTNPIAFFIYGGGQ